MEHKAAYPKEDYTAEYDSSDKVLGCAIGSTFHPLPTSCAAAPPDTRKPPSRTGSPTAAHCSRTARPALRLTPPGTPGRNPHPVGRNRERKPRRETDPGPYKDIFALDKMQQFELGPNPPKRATQTLCKDLFEVVCSISCLWARKWSPPRDIFLLPWLSGLHQVELTLQVAQKGLHWNLQSLHIDNQVVQSRIGFHFRALSEVFSESAQSQNWRNPSSSYSPSSPPALSTHFAPRPRMASLSLSPPPSPPTDDWNPQDRPIPAASLPTLVPVDILEKRPWSSHIRARERMLLLSKMRVAFPSDDDWSLSRWLEPILKESFQRI